MSFSYIVRERPSHSRLQIAISRYRLEPPHSRLQTAAWRDEKYPSHICPRALYRGVCHTKILDFRAPLYQKITIQYTKYRFHFTIYRQTFISHVIIYSLCILIYKIQIPSTKIPPFSMIYKKKLGGYRALVLEELPTAFSKWLSSGEFQQRLSDRWYDSRFMYNVCMPYMIQYGRYVNESREERICTLCSSNTVETIEHFLFECEAYDAQRLPFDLLQMHKQSLIIGKS